MGTVVGFEWSEGVPVDNPERQPRQPTAIHVLFDNKRVERLGRQFAMGRGAILEAPVSHTPVVITPATARSMTKRGTISRGINFP